MAEEKNPVRHTDMTDGTLLLYLVDMRDDAIKISTQAIEKHSIENEIAAYIKEEFDRKYSPTWHCMVGCNFGSCVTHENKHIIYFYLGQVAILLFKSG